MLDIKDLNAFYGKSHILRGVNLNIEKGEILIKNRRIKVNAKFSNE